MNILKTWYFGSQTCDDWGEMVFLRWVSPGGNITLTSEDLLSVGRDCRIILNALTLLHIFCLAVQQSRNR